VAPDLFGLDLDVVVGVVVVDELPDDIGEAVLGKLEEGAEVGLPCCCGGLDGLLQGGRSRSGGHGGRSSITSNTTRNMRRVVLGLGLRFTLRQKVYYTSSACCKERKRQKETRADFITGAGAGGYGHRGKTSTSAIHDVPSFSSSLPSRTACCQAL
jgi:hypothetical protein